MRKYIDENDYTIKTYRSLQSFGITDKSTVQEMIDAIPSNSQCTIWINDTKYYHLYNEIDAFIKNIYGGNYGYGNVTFRRFNNVWKIIFESYNSNLTLQRTYSKINKIYDSGWEIITPLNNNTIKNV